MRDRWFRIAVVVTLLLSPLSAPAQEPGTAEIEIVPPNPTPDDVVSINLSGTWPNSCAPRDPGVSRSGPEISIDTSNPGQICLQILTFWALEVPIGRLPAGTYEVTVRHSVPIGAPLVLGQAVFTVEAAGVGGVVTGLTPKRVVCWNLTTKKIVVIADGTTSWDCEEAGLRVRSGDRLLITISGRTD